jgi:hypothetical protein
MPHAAPDGLAFDIRFALVHKALRMSRTLSRVRRGIPDIELMMMADTIAEHLMLANWRIERGPPREAHGTPDRWSPQGKE